MSAKIIKNSEGRYTFNFRYRKCRIHRTCPEGWTKKQAQEFAEQLKRDVDDQLNGSYKQKVAVTVAADKYEQEVLAYQPSGNTTRNKLYALLPYITGKTIDQLPLCAQRYIEQHRGKLAVATINLHVQILRNLAKLSYTKWKLIDTPVHLDIHKLPLGNNARDNYLSEQEVMNVYRAFDMLIDRQKERLAASTQKTNAKLERSITQIGICKKAMLIACYTGLRKSEFKLITPERIVRGPAVMHSNGAVIDTAIILPPRTKNKKPRVIPVLPIIQNHLDIFPLTVETDFMYRKFKEAAELVGFGHFWFHDLRHTAASLLINSGVDLHIIQRLLGHTNQYMTERYAHLEVETLKREMLKLSERHQNVTEENSKNLELVQEIT